jgi:hypothetical protein
VPDSSVRVDEVDGQQTLVLTVPAGSGRIPGRHNVTLRTDDPEVPSYSIPITFRRQTNVRTRGATAAPTNAAKPIRVMPAGTGKKE